jgi:peptidoglycan/LPS O-acetylase OafA/YrhL
LVVLYHAGLSQLPGGYVGVDVFFVISGYVITGVLLREREAFHRTSLGRFYARRCRRIIPAASLVIIVVVLATYRVLGPITGTQTAIDARWTAVFLANFHFAAQGTNYLTASLPPSPLLNFWSLAVEEQFYLVYPTLFLLVAAVGARWWSFRARLVVVLCAVVGASFAWSVMQTASNPQAAYFSPLTRAWELALGALLAVGTPWLVKLPKHVAASASWLGLIAIGISAVWFTAETPYPGAWAALPVVGAACVVAAGTPAPQWGAETLLGRRPFLWLGSISYSLYLWHWPILILAAESAGRTSLPLSQSMAWVGVAVLASVVTYRLVENPIRHARVLSRSRVGSIGMGVVLIVVTLIVASVAIYSHETPEAAGSNTSIRAIPILSPQQVHQLVGASSSVRAVPTDISPPLSSAFFDFGIPRTWTGCAVTYSGTTEPACTFGAPRGRRTMVIFGDSHANMWATALNDIAVADGWKLVTFVKDACPAIDLPVPDPPGYGTPRAPWLACEQWRQYVISRINLLRPNLLIVTQALHRRPSGSLYTPAQWEAGLVRTLNQITAPHTVKVVLGNIATLPQHAPNCLSMHLDDAQVCGTPARSYLTPFRRAEARAAVVAGAHYVDAMPWFCTKSCSAVIGRFEVYVDQEHVTNTYARALEGVLAASLDLPAPAKRLAPTPHPITAIVRPSSGAVLLGSEVLDATAADNVPIRKLEYRITGGARRDAVIGTAAFSLDGALLRWNTKTVPNGRYEMQSILYDAAGKVGRSIPISVTVSN